MSVYFAGITTWSKSSSPFVCNRSSRLPSLNTQNDRLLDLLISNIKAKISISGSS